MRSVNHSVRTTGWEALAINMQGWVFQVGGRRIDLEKVQRAVEQETGTAIFMVPVLVTYCHITNHPKFSGIKQQKNTFYY